MATYLNLPPDPPVDPVVGLAAGVSGLFKASVGRYVLRQSEVPPSVPQGTSSLALSVGTQTTTSDAAIPPGQIVSAILTVGSAFDPGTILRLGSDRSASLIGTLSGALGTVGPVDLSAMLPAAWPTPSKLVATVVGPSPPTPPSAGACTVQVHYRTQAIPSGVKVYCWMTVVGESAGAFEGAGVSMLPGGRLYNVTGWCKVLDTSANPLAAGATLSVTLPPNTQYVSLVQTNAPGAQVAFGPST